MSREVRHEVQRQGSPPHRLAATLVQSEIDRLGCLTYMELGDDVLAVGLGRLIQMVEREKLAESQERVLGIGDTGFWMAVGMDAGYLVGLEMGKRLARGAS